jgi:hypothetical protein
MLTLLGILLFLIVAGTCWLVGFWSNLISFFCLVVAALTASSFFETVAINLEGNGSSYTYLLDFVSIWLLFFGTFGALRVAGEYFSRFRLKFNVYLEMIGRSVTSLMIAGVFVMFTAFTMHFAPIPDSEFNDNFTMDSGESSGNMYLGPLDYAWAGILSYQSNWPLSEFANAPLLSEAYYYENEDGDIVHYPGPPKEDEEEEDRGERIWNRRPFDSNRMLLTRYASRRDNFEKAIEVQEEEGNYTLRVVRDDK